MNFKCDRAEVFSTFNSEEEKKQLLFEIERVQDIMNKVNE